MTLRIAVAGLYVLAGALGQPSEEGPLCSAAEEGLLVFRGRFLGAEREPDALDGHVLYAVLEVLSGDLPTPDRSRLQVRADKWPENVPVHLVSVQTGPNPAGYVRWILDDAADSAIRITRYLRDAKSANRAGSLTVRVSDGPNGAAGVTVTVAASDGKKRSSKTDAEGKADFRALAPGSYTIEISKENYRASDPLQARVRPGSCLSESAQVWPESSIGGVLTADGVPIEGVEMHLLSADDIDSEAHVPHAVDVTAADGSFRFRTIPTGRYRLATNSRPPEANTAIVPKFYPSADLEQDGQVFEIRPGQHYDNLSFDIAGMGRMTALNVRGRMAGGAEVELDFLPFTVSDSSGRSTGNCCQATCCRPTKSRALPVFENLIYRFEPARTSKGERDSLQCFQSLPAVLPKGPKPSQLTLIFQPVPCQR